MVYCVHNWLGMIRFPLVSTLLWATSDAFCIAFPPRDGRSSLEVREVNCAYGYLFLKLPRRQRMKRASPFVQFVSIMLPFWPVVCLGRISGCDTQHHETRPCFLTLARNSSSDNGRRQDPLVIGGLRVFVILHGEDRLYIVSDEGSCQSRNNMLRTYIHASARV